MESDMAAYKSDFLQEIYECLDVFNQSFVDLENGEAAAIDEIFRITHTIKGMAGFLGYASLEHLCHSMEEVLCGIKNGDIEIDGDLVDILLLTVDRIMDIVKQIESADNDNVKIEDLLNSFENYEKMMTGKQGHLCIQPVENKVLSPKIMSIQQSEDNNSSNSECHDKKENGVTCNPDDYNLVLDITLDKNCVMKGLRATLIIESLKDISKLAKIDPDENEMDNSFAGHFKVFLSGESDEVEELMDRISEIEQFNISEIKPFNIACNEEIKCNVSVSDDKCNISVSDDKCNISVSDDKCNISVSDDKCNISVTEESQPDSPSTPVIVPEATAVSATNKSNMLHSCISSLAARLRCILNRISKSIYCFKITDSAGILPGNKCKDSSTDVPKAQEVRVLEKDSEINPAIPDQELQLDEARILEQSSGKTFDNIIPDKIISDNIIPDKIIPDKIIPDKIIPDQGLRLDKAQSPAEDSENVPIQVLQSQEIQETGESGPDSNNPESG
ncbi:MAG: Hpt domain-containing protein, partial [Methanosarcina sp.]|nr:Hpt domain-containing protein [Methanosarcina sp.]